MFKFCAMPHLPAAREAGHHRKEVCEVEILVETSGDRMGCCHVASSNSSELQAFLQGKILQNSETPRSHSAQEGCMREMC